MRSGRLNTRVLFEAPSKTKDDYGAPVITWNAVVTVWAEVRSMTGTERWASEHVANTASRVIRIRYREDIEPNMRAVHRGTNYDLVGPPVDPDGRRREMLVAVKEVTN